MDARRKFMLVVSAFGLVAMGLTSGSAWAQGEGVSCVTTVTGSDTGCSNELSCSQADGCSVYRVEALCDGTHTLKAWIKCGTGENCGHCAACVTLYTVGTTQEVAHCYTSDLQWCGQTVDCVTYCSFQLQAGNYDMKVCLVPCTESDRQTCCEEYSCEAWGCFTWGNGSACP